MLLEQRAVRRALMTTQVLVRCVETTWNVKALSTNRRGGPYPYHTSVLVEDVSLARVYVCSLTYLVLLCVGAEITATESKIPLPKESKPTRAYIHDLCDS